MRLTLLGPWGAYPKAGEATAGYLIEHGGRNILIDCGSGVLAKLQQYKRLDELDAVYISHGHYDHVADLGCLQYACLIDTDLGRRSSVLPIHFASERDGRIPFQSMSGSEIRRIEAGQTATDSSGLSITFFKTFHGAYCLGMDIRVDGRKIVYTADTYYDESLIKHCADAEVLIAETSFYKEIRDAKKYGHMNTEDVGVLAREAGVGKVVLTHLPHFGNIEQLAAEVGDIYSGKIETAYCGMVIELS
ncbi:MBL fold metallo-hydrolase [Paenibacillus oenotherae]|uniref:MBL fold metallo-hydrolase n=1 Tax=Paenibacillus oenotherae TaxID=1435645 RepID=A0ABS7DA89_9BACL|nr:MBL fold metallo-hydrolase [Paenibacillus oenotherae]MBW7476800.1 MBL fold metallo-hydrolase [Paenibacillus oenotherae]